MTAAWGGTYVPFSDISQSVDNTTRMLATVMVDIAIITGIGFFMAAFFKFHQHRQNPNQVPLSQGVSLLLIGGGLVLIPLLLPTVSVSLFGEQGADIAQVGGASIHRVIGGPNQQQTYP